MSGLVFYASQPHYLDHLVPIYRARDTNRAFHILRPAQQAANRKLVHYQTGIPRGAELVCVAGFNDLRATTPARAIFVEHGVGISYSDRLPSSPGGNERERVDLFICPNERVAQANALAYPDARVEIVGSPHVDALRLAAGRRLRFESSPSGDALLGSSIRQSTGTRREPWQGSRPASAGEVVCISHHWDSRQAPESRWAFPHFKSALPEVVKSFGHVIGHAHPRIWRFMEPVYRELGIEPVQHLEEVVQRASVYVCDNSSSQYETAACGIPQVVLNAPWYRRHVEHGFRFWDAIPGLQVDEPGELVAAIELALEDPPELADMRRAAVQEVYGDLDGKAAERAAQAIEDYLALRS